MTSGGGQRETKLARFMTRFERGVAWRRRKELVSRRGNSAVHRRSPSIRVYVREQQNPGERERAGGREGSRKTRVNGPHSTAYKLQ